MLTDCCNTLNDELPVTHDVRLIGSKVCMLEEHLSVDFAALPSRQEAIETRDVVVKDEGGRGETGTGVT